MDRAPLAWEVRQVGTALTRNPKVVIAWGYHELGALVVRRETGGGAPDLTPKATVATALFLPGANVSEAFNAACLHEDSVRPLNWGEQLRACQTLSVGSAGGKVSRRRRR